MYKATALDVVEMTLPLLGWHDKLLEIQAHRFTLSRQQADGMDVMLLGTEIDIQETSQAIYDWSTSEELTAQGNQLPNVPGSINGGGSTLVSYTSYSNAPAISLSQPDATHISMPSVVVTFSSKIVTYNARSFTIPDPTSTPTWYYVTIADPDFDGDLGTAASLAAFADTTTAKVGVTGFIYIGAILCTHAAGATATPLPGGWPSSQSFLIGA
jgi:hypothetical protein